MILYVSINVPIRSMSTVTAYIKIQKYKPNVITKTVFHYRIGTV